MKRVLLPLLPLPLLLALGAWVSARVADRAAESGVALLSLIAPLARDVSPEPAPSIETDIPTGLSLPDALAGKAPAVPPGKAAKGKAKARPIAPVVVYVTQEQVLRLASGSVRPRGAPVAANGPRPAGLRLSGVAALGIGLRDGDVLTRAVGQPALSSGAVIQAVLAARARRAPVLEGEFWRGAERCVIRVEQPYLELRPASQAPSDAGGDARLTLRESSPRFGTP